MGRDQEKWHQDVREVTNSLDGLVLDSRENSSDFLTRLRIPTDVYLKKKGSLTLDAREERLTTLIKTHSAKYVGILACAHALTRLTIRSLLRGELRVDPANDPAILGYLGVIAAIQRVNPSAIGEFEAQRARILVLLLRRDSNSFLQNLSEFFSVDDQVALDDLFPAGFIDTILQRTCSDFASQLEKFKNKCQWIPAYRSVGLISRLNISPTLHALLSRNIRSWRSWAAWRPVEYRIRGWEALSNEHRNKLLDVLALGGPDMIYETHTSLLEGLLTDAASHKRNSICHGQFLVWLDNDVRLAGRPLVNGILDFLSGPRLLIKGSVEVFSHLCLRNAVDLKTLDLLEKIASIWDPSLISSLADMFTSPTSSTRIYGVTNLLNAMQVSGDYALLEYLSKDVRDIVQAGIPAMQDRLREIIKSQGKRNPQGIVFQLQALGQSLKISPGIRNRLDPGFQVLLDAWPSEREVDLLLQLRSDAASNVRGESIVRLVDTYCLVRLVGCDTLDHDMQLVMDALLWHWEQPLHSQRRALVLSLVTSSTLPAQLQLQCVTHVSKMEDRYLKEIDAIINNVTDMACTQLAALICSGRFLKGNKQACWGQLLLWMIEQRNSTILDYTIKNMEVTMWFKWLGHLRDTFIVHPGAFSQELAILQPKLHDWSQFLESSYLAILTCLESKREMSPLVQWILRGWENEDAVKRVLNLVEGPDQIDQHPLFQMFTRLNTERRYTDGRVWQTMASVASTSALGMEACMHLINLYQSTSGRILDVVFYGWHQEGLESTDRNALEDLAVLLGVMTDPNRVTPEIIRKASLFVQERHVEMIEQAESLEHLRTALEKSDRNRTKTFLHSLAIEDVEPSLVGTGIPPALVDVVDITEDEMFEMCFPLDHLRPLQRAAMSLNAASLLIARIDLGKGVRPPSFCLHLSPETTPTPPSHRYCSVGHGNPSSDTLTCYGRPNRALFQLGGILWRYLQDARRSVEEAYNLVSLAIENLGHSCIVCGRRLPHALVRATTCQTQCSIQLGRSHLEVRMGELRESPLGVDLLLSSIYASATVRNNATLLEGCPIQNSADLVTRLNSIPSLTTFANARDLAASVNILGTESETLLSWLCTSFRGFIVPATDNLKIPSMPGVHQFFLVNSFPEVEESFAKVLTANGRRGSQANTRVVFHGTTLDRLYPILCQGLRVYSRTNLGRHGASYGIGLYVADEPTTSLGYGGGGSPTWAGSALGGHQCLVLGCELTDVPSTTHHGGIHVVKDMNAIMVRYIFLFQNALNPPQARHIVPAMQIVFSSLRARAL